jgi:DNA-binding PadR family transcriptional regulator
MAKLFPIGIEVEEVAVGRVLRILNGTPGVAKLHLNLMNETVAPKEDAVAQEIANVLPPARPPRQGSMKMIIAKVLAVAPCHNKVLKEALKRNGFSESSLPSQMLQMRLDGFVKKVGVGTWRLTEKGVRHYGDESKHNQVRIGRSGPLTNNRVGVRSIVLTALNNGAQLLARDLRRILQENEYSPKNMTGTVSKMKTEGLLSSDGGVYSITEQGRATLAAAQTMENNS